MDDTATHRFESAPQQVHTTSAASYDRVNCGAASGTGPLYLSLMGNTEAKGRVHYAGSLPQWILHQRPAHTSRIEGVIVRRGLDLAEN